MKATSTSKLFDHPLTGKVIGCAIEVHKQLGPGLLESTNSRCLAKELSIAGVNYQQECAMPVYYKGERMECGYRVDFLIEDFITIELKAVDRILRVHQAQLLTYMKLAETPIGLLLNFNARLLKDGIRKFIL